MPTTAALGSLLPVAGPFFGFRILALGLGLAALTVPANRSEGNLGRPVLSLAFLWLAAGLLLSLFAYDTTAAFRTMTSVSIGLVLALATLRITAAVPRFLQWLAQGWILSFLITSTIAFWELSTGQHLPNYFIDSGSLDSPLPAASFSNPNAYAIYLVGVQGILLWLLSRVKSRLVRAFLISASAINVLLILTTGSRLSLAGVFLLTIAYLALDRFGLWRSVLLSTVAGLLVWLLTPGVASVVYDYAPDDVRTTSLSQILVELDQGDSSAGRRVELYKTAGWLVLNTGGLGVGPGNFGAAVVEMQPPYQTGGTLSPHSFVGELAAEFGVPVLVGMCALLWSIVRRMVSQTTPERATVLATGLAFLPAGFANSGYLLASSMWALFATLLCMVAFSIRGDS